MKITTVNGIKILSVTPYRPTLMDRIRTIARNERMDPCDVIAIGTMASVMSALIITALICGIFDLKF